MAYIAKHYISLCGRTLTPAEIFYDKLDEETRERLLRLGAIEEMKTEERGAGEEKETGERLEQSREAEAREETENEDAGEREIDVMDGIAPKKTRGRGKTK